jgi:hypothetical protein
VLGLPAPEMDYTYGKNFGGFLHFSAKKVTKF